MADDIDSQDPGEATEEQRARIRRRDTDRDRTLLAMQHLEAALAAAAPARSRPGATRYGAPSRFSAKPRAKKPTTPPSQTACSPTSHGPSRGCVTGSAACASTTGSSATPSPLCKTS
jgi:hypothetical protein